MITKVGEKICIACNGTGKGNGVQGKCWTCGGRGKFDLLGEKRGN